MGTVFWYTEATGYFYHKLHCFGFSVMCYVLVLGGLFGPGPKGCYYNVSLCVFNISLLL